MGEDLKIAHAVTHSISRFMGISGQHGIGTRVQPGDGGRALTVYAGDDEMAPALACGVQGPLSGILLVFRWSNSYPGEALACERAFHRS